MEEAKRLHNKLLYTTIAINYLHSTVDNGIPEKQFRANFKNYADDPLSHSERDVYQMIEILEIKGLVSLGDYDILLDIVQFDARIVHEIESAKLVMQTIGISIYRRTDVNHTKVLVEDFSHRYIVVQIPVTDELVVQNETDHAFQRDIKSITMDLENYGFELCRTVGADMQEYQKKCRCFKVTLSESINLLNIFSDHTTESRKENILKLAQDSCAMIKTNNEEFYQLQKRWESMNCVMKDTSVVFNSLSGMTTANVLFSSLFLLLEAESVQTLDRFWQEYREGKVKTEFQQKLFSGRESELTVNITEENYKQYRKFLANDTEILSLTSTSSAETGGTVELVCEGRHIKTEVSWFIGANEIKDGGRYAIKKIGFCHILLIYDFNPTFEVEVTAAAGLLDKVSVYFNVNDATPPDYGEEQALTSAQDAIPSPISSERSPLIHPSQAVIQCNGCKTEAEVDKFCTTCRQSLCGKCAESHKRDKITHDIVSRTGKVIRESEASTILTHCTLHPEYNYSKYCNHCDKPCCIKCIDDEHKYHPMMAIESKYIACEDKLNDLAKEMEKCIIPTLVSNIDELKRSKHLQAKGCQDVTEEVNRIRSEMKAAVDERCDEMLDELNKKESEKISSISDAICDLEKQIKESEIFISKCSEKVREGGLDLIEYSKVTPPTTLPSNSSYAIPTFVPGENMLDSITKLIGNLKWKGREINLTKPSKPRMPDSENLKPDINIKPLGSFRTDADCTSVTPTSKDTAWVASVDSDTMMMYNISGKNIRSVTVTKGVGILDLAVKQSGEVIICNKDNKVRLVTVNGVVTNLIETAPYSPQGVCLNEREDIVVCMAAQGDGNHVVVYSPDGKKPLRRIVVKDDKGKQLLTDPYRVVVNGEYISVMNYGSNVVTCDEDGKVRWVYGGSRTGLDKLYAMGMCVDKFCNLFISDWDNICVHYVDRAGGLIQILLTRQQHGIHYPMGVGVDDDTGTVWVGGGEWGRKRVWIYRYLQS